jgi:hypothetical protein
VQLASNDAPLPGAAADDLTTPPAGGTSDAGITPTPTADADQSTKTWHSTPVVGDLASPKFYSIAELNEVANVATTAGREFLAGNMRTRDSRKAMGQAYMKLCADAERLTLIDPAADVTELFLYETDAKAPLERVAGDQARRADLDEIAYVWWNYKEIYKNERKNQGVLFVGQVTEVRQQGKWTECLVETAGASRIKVPVLMDGVRYASGSSIAVAGLIVRDPQQKIAGYRGDAPQAVIAGYMFDPANFGPADADQAGEQSGPSR